jgi:hypothetical protein
MVGPSFTLFSLHFAPFLTAACCPKRGFYTPLPTPHPKKGKRLLYNILKIARLLYCILKKACQKKAGRKKPAEKSRPKKATKKAAKKGSKKCGKKGGKKVYS